MYQIKVWLKQMFTYPPLSLERVDYDEYWHSKRGKDMGELSDWQIARANFVVEMLKGKSVDSISDIACGEGNIVSYIGKKVHARDLYGTDISDIALERAAKFGVKASKLDVGRVEELGNIPPADYEILFEILEHVPHSEELLRMAYEKAGNGVFFSFPNTGFFVHRLRLFFGRFPLQWKLFPGEHVRYWTKRDLLWWVRSLGYEDFTVHYYKGVPVLNKICPSWFAAGFVVYLPK